MVRVIMIVVGLGAAVGTALWGIQPEAPSPDPGPAAETTGTESASADVGGDEALSGSQQQLFDRYPGLLFLIGKSANANIVLYRGMTQQGQWQSPEVESEWLMLAEQGQIEAVTTLEEKAFGFTVSPGDDAAARALTLQAVPERAITLTYDETLQRPVASTVLNGQNVRLVRIFVQATSNFLGVPTVEYIDLFGYDKDQNVVTERLTND